MNLGITDFVPFDMTPEAVHNLILPNGGIDETDGISVVRHVEKTCKN